ncbi:MAG: hypothetical protein U1E38_09385, partial [Rhodospirillales bacterium]
MSEANRTIPHTPGAARLGAAAPAPSSMPAMARRLELLRFAALSGTLCAAASGCVLSPVAT